MRRGIILAGGFGTRLSRAETIEKEPARPRSNHAVIGLYVCDHSGQVPHLIRAGL